MHSTILPEPDAESQLQSETLRHKICDEITRKGPIPFVRYMELALYEPALGYYCSGNIKFGKSGDFITAPELTPLFGQCIATQCEAILKNLSPNSSILELGAGSGKMARDILLELEKRHTLPQGYWILELSPALKNRQKALFESDIPHLCHKIQWLSALPQQPFEGIILANEVLDAMPVHRFKQEKTVQEYYVTHDEKQLKWMLSEPSDTRLIQSVKALHLPQDYTSEINLWIRPWLIALYESLSHGNVLIIDYGYPAPEYYHPQRNQGTLACHYRHRTHDDPLIFPGLQDITAHVDFSAVEHYAVQAGFQLESYSSQAHFLIHCKLLERVSALSENLIDHYQTNQAVKQLILPHEMGELFKVMLLKK